jgi:hypothetical protein
MKLKITATEAFSLSRDVWRTRQDYLNRSRSDFRESFQAWKAGIEKCFASDGNYFEGDDIQIK